MRPILRIMRYVLLDVLRNRWVIGYFLFFVVATDVLLRLAGTGPRAMVSLLNRLLGRCLHEWSPGGSVSVEGVVHVFEHCGACGARRICWAGDAVARRR